MTAFSRADHVELSLRKALCALEPLPAKVLEPRRGRTLARIKVAWSVRHKWGGAPFSYVFEAPLGCWKSHAEHLAKQAILAENLVPWILIETTVPE